MEYHLIYLDHASKQAKVLLNSKEIQDGFNSSANTGNVFTQPEYGAWMIEAIPKVPFSHINLADVSQLDVHFKSRRNLICNYLSSFGPISLSSCPSFPMLGVGDYAIRMPEFDAIHDIQKVEEKSVKNKEENKEIHKLPLSTSENKYSESLFTFDAAINSHPRFPTLSQIIRQRRCEKVCIKAPLFIDSKTIVPSPPTPENPFLGEIYMDSMAFGMGCCCLQLTFEAESIDYARHLHDQLLVLAPILSALSATSPIYRGKLSDIDLRFKIISQSVDDRTKEERDPSNGKYIHKSRYSMNSHFISNNPSIMPHHNDSIPLKVDPDIINMLKEGGVDDRLAYHIAGLFVRDPLVVFEKAIYVDDSKETNHFENLQSTNWNAIRFKPPPSFDSTIGWRVEFRPMDIQLTDNENAALSSLVILLVKLIIEYDVNFIIPISLCDENMERAHKRDAILNEKFFFRKNIIFDENYKNKTVGHTEKEIVEEMSLVEILEGKAAINYKGIFPLIEELIAEQPGSLEEKNKIREYLQFLKGRASGQYKTGAKFIRDFVLNHPNYKQDSIVTHEIAYDLLKYIDYQNANNVDAREMYKTFEAIKEEEFQSVFLWGSDMLSCY